MTPFEMIKFGIETNDMKMVQKAYKLMSGDKVPIGVSTSGYEEGQAVSSRDEDGYIAKINADFNGGKSVTKKVPLKLLNRNLFVDHGDRGDKDPTQAKPTRKKKVQSLYVDVVCKECGDKFTVNKEVLPVSFDADEKTKIKTYVCDNCLARRK